MASTKSHDIFATKPFIILLMLLLVALIIQFSIVITWFHRQQSRLEGHRNLEDVDVLLYGNPSLKITAVDKKNSSSVVINAAAGDTKTSVAATAAKGSSIGKPHVLPLRKQLPASKAKQQSFAVAKQNTPKVVWQKAIWYKVNDHASHPPETLNAVIHIGPYKTATTAIQEYSHKLIKELAQDNYEMPWSHLQKKITDQNLTKLKTERWWHKQIVFGCCFYQSVPTTRTSAAENAGLCNREILNAGIEIAEQNKNSILVSAEQFANSEEEGVEALRDYLSNRWNNVTIVAAYRRYYEWVVSFYHERQKGFTLYETAKANKTDRLFPSLYHELYFNTNFTEEIKHKYSLPTIARFKKYFRNVVVMNYHDKSKSLVERFYCDVVPNATTTCRKLKMMKISNKINTSQQRVYELLAYAAHRRGLINIQSKKNAVLAVKMIQLHQNRTLNLTSDDFPRKYVSQDILNDIWDISLQAEREFVGVDDSAVESLKDKFDKISKTNYCEVDLDAILESTLWVKFFMDLNVALLRQEEETKKALLKKQEDKIKALLKKQEGDKKTAASSTSARKDQANNKSSSGSQILKWFLVLVFCSVAIVLKRKHLYKGRSLFTELLLQKERLGACMNPHT